MSEYSNIDYLEKVENSRNKSKTFNKKETIDFNYTEYNYANKEKQKMMRAAANTEKLKKWF